VIAGFCREVDENCALLSHYAASSGNFDFKFLTGVSGQPIGPVFKDQESLEDGLTRCPETSERKFHHSLRNNPEERSSQNLTKMFK
jgi:hypothetical protein